ncbi:MAG: threonine--tRNA ligase [Candidatus Limnocylindria bacterium]
MAQQERRADHGPEALYALRHSTAHVMAGAVLELFPEAKFGFGPPVVDGFYYDFDLPRPLLPDDLGRIEERMRAMVRRDAPFEHRDMSVPAALRFFRERGQDYKVDQIEKLDETVADGAVSIYEHGGFVDLCRGPHVPTTGAIGAFKLLSVAGAYWRGDEKNRQLQRVYGTVWPSQPDLDAYLERLKEIERRDHRRLGKDLELFDIDEELGSGLVLWLPNLAIVRQELETWWRRVHQERGYTLVYTPHIGHERMYQRSGHLEKFAENMYGPLLLDEAAHGGSSSDGGAPRSSFWIKPMNCPGHIKVYQARGRSYRELPLRIGELGTVYRYERGGSLHGMLRVRGFTQDDSHIFCTPQQAQSEIAGVYDLVTEFLRVFGYRDAVVYLSTRPEKRLGTDQAWDQAEGALRCALEARGVDYRIDEGGGTFYAPKIDFKVRDAIGREWQGPTIQVDMQLPERFDVTYVSQHGQRERAVMIHRVLFGSLERFVGGLIEHYAGNFPLWLAWDQVALIPVRESARAYAEEVAALLRGKGIRVALDPEPGDLRAKVRDAQARRPNYILVVGDKEAAARQLSVRKRGAGGAPAPPGGPSARPPEERGVALDDFVARVALERDTKALPHDFDPGTPPDLPPLEAAGA